MIVCEWNVTGEMSRLVWFPYDMDTPYSTCEFAALSVVHVMVALTLVMFDTATAEMTGGVTGA